MHETATLAAFAAEASYEKLPDDVTELAKRCTLDFLGAALFGATTEWGRLIANFAIGNAAKPESTVLSRGEKSSASLAALVNGTMGHGYEIDDVFPKGMVHPGAIVIPAALAVAEKEEISGKSFIAAVVVGYELVARVGLAVGGSSFMRGFHTSGTAGPFGAAAAVGNILRLNSDGMLHAFGLAGSMGAGLMEFSQDSQDTMVKRLHCGRAAEAGVVAAQLAKGGFTGPRTVLEGKFGFCKALSDEPRVDLLTERLGDEYQIRRTWFKTYSCCGAHHSTIDALLDLRKKHALQAQDIASVLVEVCQKSVDQNCAPDPKSIMSAQYSVPFAAAAALIGDPADPSVYAEGFRSAELLAQINKVKVVASQEMTALFPGKMSAKVTVTTCHGEKHDCTVYDCRGTPENPQSYDELCIKFRKLASHVLTDAQVDGAIGAIADLEKLSTMRKLSSIVSHPQH